MPLSQILSSQEVSEVSEGAAARSCGHSIPRDLWSLADVYRFGGATILTDLLWLAMPECELVSGMIDEAEYRKKIRDCLQELRDDAEKSRLSAIASQADVVLKKWTTDDVDPMIVRAIISQFIGTAQTELAKHMYFRIADTERAFYESVRMEESAAIAFPSSVRDIREAGKCFALDRTTACVLHLMRALECPLQALVRVLDFTPSNPNWETVINECEREIRKIGQLKARPTWKEDESFYSEAALNFRYFKNAWRNHAMHGRDTYDKGDAYEIFTHVVGFMEHLSKKISEQGAATA
jgi:hypothetical protein